MIILIPAYEPDEKLVGIVQDITHRTNAQVLVIDDGSGTAYAPYFEAVRALGATVLTHAVNRGKGAALKTGFAYIREMAEQGTVIVTADSDGQHLVEDIARVATRVQAEPDRLVLGVRSFVGKVPVRSRFGNKVTAVLFRLATGQPVTDTQTGLRGFSSQHLDWLLSLSGERFEYEFNMLLESKRSGFAIAEEPIQTIYIEENKSSHFRPIRDSLRIYAPFVTFLVSSGAAALLDMGLLVVMMTLTQNLLLSVIVARLLSAGLQYLLNAKLVFHQNKRTLTSLMRYGLLVITLLACNALLLQTLVSLGLGLVLAKVCTELFLFFLSYRVQQGLVFG